LHLLLNVVIKSIDKSNPVGQPDDWSKREIVKPNVLLPQSQMCFTGVWFETLHTFLQQGVG
jgi:hypothetical protein